MKRAKAEENDETHLSGAYIRSFVKQLSSSKNMSPQKPNLEREAADPSPPPPHKKQVRRRLQTRKPYQEKLLNMAEARREIVSALKLHRAAMKQQQQQQQIIQSPPDFQSDQKSRRNPRIYASSISPWPAPPPPHLPASPESAAALFDFALPRQALGLNLNLHDFFITAAPSSSSSSSSIYSSSSPSTSSSPPPPPPEMPAEVGFMNCGGLIGGEEEMEEEIASSPFDEVMEFPPWVNANESCLQLQQLDDRDFSVLPCMEIEEIEGMDGDWLA